MNVDDEWKMFLSAQNNLYESDEKKEIRLTREKKDAPLIKTVSTINTTPVVTESLPDEICEELYISTKTKVVFLNQEIDINRIFWNIPILDYWQPKDGVVKKQNRDAGERREAQTG